MKKLLSLVITCLALLVGTAVPAQAYKDDPYINGRKFASTSICVGSTLLQTTYRVGYVAQTINNQTQTLALDYSTDCAADGYPPSRRMVVGTFQNASHGSCLIFTNQQFAIYNGFSRWTNGPGIYLNTGISTCVGTQTQRDHWISQAVAWHLGLHSLDDSHPDTWRVMHTGNYSRDNVGVITYTEGLKLDQIYTGQFCDSGNVC